MAKGRRLKPEQIVTLLLQIDDLTTNGKPLTQTLKIYNIFCAAGYW